MLDLLRFAGGSKPAAFVFLHAHPDDETLWTGGLIATLAASGARVIVITCTRGERGEVITAPGTATESLGYLMHDAVALASYRSSELKAALAALGQGIEHHFLDQLGDTATKAQHGGQGSANPRHYAENGNNPRHSARSGNGAAESPRCDGDTATNAQHSGQGKRYQDSGMVWLVPPTVLGNGTSTGGVAGPDPEALAGFANVPVAEPAARLAVFLRALSAEQSDGNGIVLVTYEKDGGYGHPDHVKAHQVAVRACELVVEQQTQAVNAENPELSSAAMIEALPLRLQLWEVTKPREPADLEVPVAPVLPQLLAAMHAYPSQVQDICENPRPNSIEQILVWFALSNGVPLPIRSTENYRITEMA